MAYFNHAFRKCFVIGKDSVMAAGVNSSALLTGANGPQFAVLDADTYLSLDAAGISATSYLMLAQSSFHSPDIIGNNPGHGGYSESTKSKGIQPKYITQMWTAPCCTVSKSTTKICVGPTCAPCGELLYLRLDAKGSPALRFLNHNAYALGDSSGSAAINAVPGICCADGQDYLDPAVALAKAAAMLLEDPIISPLAQEPSGGGIVVTGGTQAGTYTIAAILNGTYTPSTDPVGDSITEVCVTFEGAYIETKFGDCSFDTRDHYNKEPIQLVGSVLDETGNPCNNCGVVTNTPGCMGQTSGETVLREILMTEQYMQNPYNQGNPDSARIREIEGSDDVLSNIDRTINYQQYNLLHSVPRFNNPTGVFDNDQYLYSIYIKCDDTPGIADLEVLLNKIALVADVTIDVGVCG